MGNQLTHLLGEGGGAALHLGGFQQVAASLVENHTAKTIRQHRWHLASFHIVGVEHGAGARAHLGRGGGCIPAAQVIRLIGGAVAPAHARAVLTIGGEHVQPHRLMQADVAAEGAITGGHKHFLPVARIAAAPGLEVCAVFLQLVGAFQQAGSGLGELRTALQPIELAGGEIPEIRQAFKATAAVERCL